MAQLGATPVYGPHRCECECSWAIALAAIGNGWTPRELRTTFVSLMSHQGVAIEEIARLVGHASTRTTEIVYRRELRPVITTGAQIMDKLFTEASSPRAAPRAGGSPHKPATTQRTTGLIPATHRDKRNIVITSIIYRSPSREQPHCDRRLSLMAHRLSGSVLWQVTESCVPLGCRPMERPGCLQH
jgi:hypothetical protein